MLSKKQLWKNLNKRIQKIAEEQFGKDGKRERKVFQTKGSFCFPFSPSSLLPSRRQRSLTTYLRKAKCITECTQQKKFLENILK